MKQAAQESAKQDGAMLISAAGKFDGDNQSQVAAIENMVARGVKGILITRSNGFLKGFGIKEGDPQIVGSAETQGDHAKGQADGDAAAYTALQQAGKEKGVTIVSIDGGCTGVQNVKRGIIAASSQQYPRNMAVRGVKAVVNFANTGNKVSGYTDTGVNLITDKAMSGVPSKDIAYGLANRWG